MIIKDVNLETVCGITSKLPANTQPEFAFAGKSNVGKSSLINALMNRRSYARTSSQPGKTQTINFYHINDAFYYVDLPGYGYARASVEVKAKWGKMIENYLHKSQMLRCVFLLIDIRHEPSSNDKLMYDWIVSQASSRILIATKADKIKAQPAPETVKDSQNRSGSRHRSDDDSVLRRDKTGQRRDLELSGDGDLEGGTSGGIDAGG